MKMNSPLLFALVLIGSLAWAQQPGAPVQPQLPQPPGQRPIARVQVGGAPVNEATLAENYVLGLTVSDQDQTAAATTTTTEFSLVVASQDFKTTFLDAKSAAITFSGTVDPGEDGTTVLVRYAIASEVPVAAGQNSVQYKATAAQASVRLRLGEPVLILKAGTRSLRLSIARLAEGPAAGKVK